MQYSEFLQSVQAGVQFVTVIQNVGSQGDELIYASIDHTHHQYSSAADNYDIVEALIADVVTTDPPTGVDADESLMIGIQAVRDELQMRPTYLNDIVYVLSVVRGLIEKNLEPVNLALIKRHMVGPVSVIHDLANEQRYLPAHAEIAKLFDRYHKLVTNAELNRSPE